MRGDPMPPLPRNVVLAVGYSSGDGRKGIWLDVFVDETNLEAPEQPRGGDQATAARKEKVDA